MAFIIFNSYTIGHEGGGYGIGGVEVIHLVFPSKNYRDSYNDLRITATKFNSPRKKKLDITAKPLYILAP